VAGGGAIWRTDRPNGAGKTTLFNCLSRLYHFDQARSVRGAVADTVFGCTGSPRSASAGRSRILRCFNLDGARKHHDRRSLPLARRIFRQCRRFAVGASEERDCRTVPRNWPRFWSGIRRRGWSRDLPFGFQKRVELARALAARPQLLLPR
jgi:branched-chain amino acid transport system ATP-binding protein